MKKEPSTEDQLQALKVVTHMHAIALNSMMASVTGKGSSKAPYIDLIQTAADDYEADNKTGIAAAIRAILTSLK